MSSGVLYSGFFTGACCLRFFYHMSTGGYLRVFINESESKRRNPYVLIWEKVGPQGNNWKKMEKSITGATKPYEVCGLMFFKFSCSQLRRHRHHHHYHFHRRRHHHHHRRRRRHHHYHYHYLWYPFISMANSLLLPHDIKGCLLKSLSQFHTEFS